MKTIILSYIFCSKKSKVMLATMVTPISSQVKDNDVACFTTQINPVL